MPGTGDPPVCCEDALDHRRSIMRAFGTNGLDGAGSVDKKYLGTFDALNLDFLLVASLKRQGRDVLEFELGHGSSRDGEMVGLERWRREMLGT